MRFSRYVTYHVLELSWQILHPSIEACKGTGTTRETHVGHCEADLSCEIRTIQRLTSALPGFDARFPNTNQSVMLPLLLRKIFMFLIGLQDKTLLAELRRLSQVHSREGRGLRALPPSTVILSMSL